MNLALTNLPSPLLVGVSGGADSVYLLHQLARHRSDGLVVCHVNHGLRGGESDADAAFVERLANQYDVIYEEKSVDLPQLMQEQGVNSFETIARGVRLTFFSEMAVKYGAGGAVLAHHADDQAETLLMNLCRGSAGLKGIESKVHLADYELTLYRPLLGIRKNEITNWLKSEGLIWREDATNQEAIATRNRVRNEVMPLLEDVFKREVVPNVNRSYQASTRKLFPEMLVHMKVLDPQGRLFLPKLEEVSEDLQKLILHTYLHEKAVKNLAEQKIQECLKLIHEEGVWKVNMPGNVFLRRKEKRIFLDA